MRTTGEPRGVEAFRVAAATYDSWFETPLGAYVDAMECRALRTLLEGLVSGSVIEIGAGTGRVARRLSEWGARVTAVEPSAAMRRVGQRGTTNPPIDWLEARAEALPCRDASFGGAVFFTTLEFVDDPAAALSEAMRVVRADGWIAAGFLHALSPWVAAYRRRGDLGRMPWAAARYFVPEDLERMAGIPARRTESAVCFAPAAEPPFAAAEQAGVRAGNAPAMSFLLWSKAP